MTLEDLLIWEEGICLTRCRPATTADAREVSKAAWMHGLAKAERNTYHIAIADR